MEYKILPSPLLGDNSPLDKEAKTIIQKTYEAEWEKSQDLPTDDPLDPKRYRRVELTWDEMMSQSQAITTTLTQENDSILEISNYFGRLPITRIIFTGCGDSLTSMIGIRALYEGLLGIPCEPIESLDLAYYYHHSINKNTLVIGLSSSGATTKTVEAILLAQKLGAYTLVLTNTPGSILMKIADRGLLIHAERKGWPTQSSTSAMALLAKLGLEITKVRKSTTKLFNNIENEFDKIPELISHVLERTNSIMESIAKIEVYRKIYLYTGGGPAYASALIGAAKVKECSPDHAIAIPLEEFHHYNSQKAGDPLFLLSPKGSSLPRALDTLHEGKRWGGQVYSIVTVGKIF
jgi:glucosamine--fructose-6-phosphate aminotransferase (isomerizing)